MAVLESFGPGIWLASGGDVVSFGFRYPTRMAVVRLEAGLWVWSPVALGEALREEVAALGPVAHLVAPNALHHLSLGDWVRAFPQARVWGAPGLAQKRGDLVFGGVLGDAAEAAWGGEIDQVMLRTRIADEVVFFHRASGTVLFCDLMQQFPPGWFPGWRGVVARLDGMVGAAPAVPRKFRLAIRDRAAARQALRRVLDWPVERVVMAHGAPVATGGRAALERGWAWLG